MSFQKGKQKTGGRQKGVENKINAEIKDMIRQALDEEGGVEYFRKQAKDNPTAFMTLIGKTIPSDVNAKITGAVKVDASIEFI